MAVTHRVGARSADAPWRQATWPDVRPQGVVLAYDRLPLDTLYVAFEDNSAPGYYISMADADEPHDGLLLKVADDDSLVIEAMIEGYLVGAHSRWPTWLAVAAAAGISDEVLDAFGLVPGTSGLDRDVAIAAFIAEIRNAWDGAVGT